MSENWKILKSNEEFEALKKADVPVFVIMSAHWCPPCQTLKPKMAKLAEEGAGKYIIVYVDVDEFGELAQNYGVTSIP